MRRLVHVCYIVYISGTDLKHKSSEISFVHNILFKFWNRSEICMVVILRSSVQTSKLFHNWAMSISFLRGGIFCNQLLRNIEVRWHGILHVPINVQRDTMVCLHPISWLPDFMGLVIRSFAVYAHGVPETVADDRVWSYVAYQRT